MAAEYRHAISHQHTQQQISSEDKQNVTKLQVNIIACRPLSVITAFIEELNISLQSLKPSA